MKKVLRLTFWCFLPISIIISMIQHNYLEMMAWILVGLWCYDSEQQRAELKYNKQEQKALEEAYKKIERIAAKDLYKQYPELCNGKLYITRERLPIDLYNYTEIYVDRSTGATVFAYANLENPPAKCSNLDFSICSVK